MGLGSFPSGQTTVREVIDQGDAWLVRARVGLAHCDTLCRESKATGRSTLEADRPRGGHCLAPGRRGGTRTVNVTIGIGEAILLANIVTLFVVLLVVWHAK